jgi:hypothetical protein
MKLMVYITFSKKNFMWVMLRMIESYIFLCTQTIFDIKLYQIYRARISADIGTRLFSRGPTDPDFQSISPLHEFLEL